MCRPTLTLLPTLDPEPLAALSAGLGPGLPGPAPFQIMIDTAGGRLGSAFCSKLSPQG